jgi:alpha-N-arabinofuranosidase
MRIARLLLLFAPLLPIATAQRNPGIENGGFESSEVASGWNRTPPDAPAGLSVQLDAANHREGRQSVRITADRTSSFSLYQKVFLPVGTLWRASAWIFAGREQESPKTVGLRVETPAGNQGSSRLQAGKDGWQQAQVLFRVPSPGWIRLRLIAFDHSSGKVWFDDARLEPMDEAERTEEIDIASSRISVRPIDLKQGGQFIEPLCRLLSSMVAQQVDSTSFEEEPAWRPSYKREIDKPYRPWYPDGAVHLATYSLDPHDPFNGKRSQKIELPAARSWAGISQDGFYLGQGHRYRLRLHLRSEGNVEVRASLHGDGGGIAEAVSLGSGSAAWKGADVILTARKSSTNGTLTIEFRGPGTLWLDRVYLIDEEAVLGIWRPDVVEALEAMNPGVIRFGGSTLEVFEWDKCLGNWDRRAPYATEPWGGLDPNFIGVEEFVQLCRRVKAEPLICVRWTGKKPSDAAAEVEYFNGGPDTAWGRVRRQNGHPEPYRVKYWQIGNEIGGGEYDASVKAFAEAMRQVDPAIKVLSSFPSAGTLKLGGGYLDYLCPHHYEAGDLISEERSFQDLRNQIAQYSGGKDVRVAVTEWNTTAGQMGLTRGMLLTLGNALSCSRYQNLMHRYSNLVEIAIRSNLSDSFGSGVIQPGPGWLYRSPTYYSQTLYQRAAGTFPLQVVRQSDLAQHLEEPDLSATISADGSTLRIYGVNSTQRKRKARINLKGFAGSIAGARIFVLADGQHAGDSEAMNTHDDPNRVSVSIIDAPIKGSLIEYAFEPLTVTLLECGLRRPL